MIHDTKDTVYSFIGKTRAILKRGERDIAIGLFNRAKKEAEIEEIRDRIESQLGLRDRGRRGGVTHRGEGGKGRAGFIERGTRGAGEEDPGGGV